MKSTTIAVDLAKSVFEVAVSDRPGRVRERRRLSRGQFEAFLSEQAPAEVVMEACGMAHHWAREARARGHEAILLPPTDVRRYVRGNKTDRADAKALLEARRNEDVRPVPVKSIDQHVLASLHRLRSAWMATRTARLNLLRGLARELGVTIPVGASRVVPAVWALVADAESPIPELLRAPLAEVAREVEALEEWIGEVERSLKRLAAESPAVERLRTIPGSPRSRRTSRPPKRATTSASKPANARRYPSRFFRIVSHDSPACAPSRTRSSNRCRPSRDGTPHSASW